MAQVSRRPVDRKVEARMYEILWQSLAKLDQQDKVGRFLKDLLTPTERVMVAKRLAIAILLNKGWGQESIDKTLKVSGATIQSIRRILSDSGEGYRQVIEQLSRDESWEETMGEIGQFLQDNFTLRGQIKALTRSPLHEEYQRLKNKKIL